ncbi:MAG: class I SAM-dependent methyltransferase [Ferruginibacter sp.]|nr:class I SAM-dependent methyltransferase [Ferruginibacter sp.]
MKITGVDWLKTKYSFLLADTSKKGLFRSVAENLYEFRSKKKFKAIGVSHPDYCSNLDKTNSMSANKDAHENQPSSFYSLKKAFGLLDLDSSNISLLDIGCGAGRVLSFGMLLNFKEVYGVDLDDPALQKAMDNCKEMKKKGYKTSFYIGHEDACNYNIPKSVNVIYLFNPFGEKTMKQVFANIVKHANLSGNELYIVYSNPACNDVFTKYESCTKIFESYYKSKKPDIFIFKISPSVFSQGTSSDQALAL